MSPKFVVRIDDVAPGMPWGVMDRLARTFDAYGVKPLLGVVPDNRDPELDACPRREDFWELVRGWTRKGWTVAQHGYQHLYCTTHSGLLKLNASSEFAGLPYEEQRRKLALGREILKEKGTPTDVFMAPAHSYDRNTLRALADLGFTHVTDGYGLFPRRRDGLLFVPQLFRKPYHFGIGVYTLCLHPSLMSENDLSAFDGFCAGRKGDIVSFPEAAAMRGPEPLSSLSAWLLSGGIQAARAARRALR